MKILTNNMTSPVKSNGDYIKLNKKEGKEQVQKQSFDTITIGSPSVSDLPANEFAAILKNQIANEVKAGTSSYKLNEIKTQIALGEYDINAVDIVRKMMVDGVEG